MRWFSSHLGLTIWNRSTSVSSRLAGRLIQSQGTIDGDLSHHRHYQSLQHTKQELAVINEKNEGRQES
jgi:hypothetical protein